MEAKDIPVVLKERPTSGMGAMSPRYELYTKCCDHFIGCDDDLEVVRHNVPSSYKLSDLVIKDLGPVARR